MRITVLVATAGLLLLTSWFTCEAGERAYRLVDDEGVTHITDAPTDPRYRPMFALSGTASGWLKVPETTRRVRAFTEEIRDTAERYGVSAALVEAVIRVESAFNPWAVSRKGAQGLMQLMPQTASALGVRDSFNPRQNIDGGVRHLRYLLDRYPGDMALALAAYNAGEGAVDLYRGIPPYAETQQYVKKVLEYGGMTTTTAAAATTKSEAPKTPQQIYRYEDNEGTLTFSNLPPVTRARNSR